MSTTLMSITPKAIQDLLDAGRTGSVKAAKQSRLRAWNALQRIRALLSELGKTEIPPPAQKTFDAEGEILEQANKLSRNLSGFGARRSKVCVLRSAASGTQPSRKNVKAITRTLFKRCGKHWIGPRI